MSDPQITALLDQLAEKLQVVVLALEGAKAEMDAAVLAEREACAKVAEERFPDPLASAVISDIGYEHHVAAGQIAALIRARGVSVCPSVAATSTTTP